MQLLDVRVHNIIAGDILASSTGKVLTTVYAKIFARREFSPILPMHAELEITVGHQTVSVHIAQMSEHIIICSDIMSRHSLEQ